MTKDEAINVVILRFNFDRVHRIMKAMGWTWYNAIDEIPSIGELKATARMLLEKVKEQTSVSTGGLEAVWRDGEYGLRFIPEQWEVDLEWTVEEACEMDDPGEMWERDLDDFYDDLADELSDEEDDFEDRMC